MPDQYPSDIPAPSAWRRHFKRILERLSGPTLSVIAHAVLIMVVLTRCSGTANTRPEETFEASLDASVDELLLDELEPELDDTPLADYEIADMAIPEPGMAAPVEVLDVTEDLAVQDNESPLTLLSVAAGAVLQDNSVSSLQLQRKAASAFGFDKNIKGDLIGTMYDLKRNGAGHDRPADFYADLHALVKERFAKKALKNYYRIPKQLYLSQLFLPYVKADTGPAAFGVGELMEPTKWIIHYTGQFQAPLAGRYRFVGEFDDVIIVFVDGEVVLEAGWGDNVTGWKPKDHVGEHKCYTTHALVYGNWLELNGLEPHRIDMVIGENPGGWLGGLLLLEQEGRPYAMDEKGRPVLPLFTVQPPTPEALAAMRSIPGWRFDEQHVPIMGVRRDRLASRTPDTNDVVVTIQ